MFTEYTSVHPSQGHPMRMKLELVPLPVADIERSLRFYTEQVGFTLDVDVAPADGVRFVQLTPEGSSCSLSLSHGVPMLEKAPPGSARGIHLVVEDIEAAREELIARGIEVSEIVHVGGGVRYADFADPDGN